MDKAKRDCILAAAAATFSRLGYKKASIDEIARHAGVGKGTIYLAASSKRDLFVKVIARELDRWSAAVSDALPPGAAPLELIRARLTLEVDAVRRFPLVEEVLTGRVTSVFRDAARARDVLTELKRHARRPLFEVLRSGARSGALRRDLDLEEVAVLLQDLESTALLFHADRPTRDDDLYHRWDTAIELLAGGLAPS